MFYEPKNGHGLPHDPFLAIVAPRPIGWISSIGPDGVVNLAPYSFFNAVGARPPMVVFSSEGHKDSVQNIRQSGEFVVNLATFDLKDAMNETSRAVPPTIDEFQTSGLTPAPCTIVKPPRVAESPAALECKVLQIVDLEDLDGNAGRRWLTIGQVVGVHIDERCLNGKGAFDMVAAQTLARCGYWDYTVVREIFSMPRPDAPPNHH